MGMVRRKRNKNIGGPSYVILRTVHVYFLGFFRRAGRTSTGYDSEDRTHGAAAPRLRRLNTLGITPDHESCILVSSSGDKLSSSSSACTETQTTTTQKANKKNTPSPPYVMPEAEDS